VPKIQEINTNTAQKTDNAVGTMVNGVWAVVADRYVQSLNRGFNQPFGINSPFGDIDDDQNMTGKQPQCIGACSEYSKKSELDGLLNVSEKTGGNVKAVALEAAENALSYELEFLEKRTLSKANYDKKGKHGMVNKGRDLIDLVETTGRQDRYEKLENDIDGKRMGFVISEEDVEKGRHYIDVFYNRKNEVEELAIQFDGSIEDLHRLNDNLALLTGENASIDETDFSKPLFSDREISLEEIVHAIEESYINEENRQNAGEYLTRLRRDTSDLSHLDEYQERALKLASQIEQELLSKGNLREGLAALVWSLEAVANGEEFNVPEHSYYKNISDTPQQESIVTTRTDELAAESHINHLIPIRLNVTEDNEKIQDSLVVSLFRRVIESEQNQDDFLRLSREPAFIFDNNADVSPVWRKFASTTLHISEQSAQKLEDHIAGVYKIMGDQKRIIDFVSTTGIATVGALASLHIIGNLGAIPVGTAENKDLDGAEINHEEIFPNPLRIQKEPVFESTVTVLEKSMYTKSEKNLIFSLFLKDTDGKEGKDISHEGEDTELILLAKIIELMNMRGQDVTTFKKIIDFVRIIDALPVEKQVVAIQKEEEQTVTVLQLLWETVQELIKPVNESERTRVRNVKNEGKSEPNEAVEQVSFTIGIWMMLKILNYYNALESLRSFVAKPHQKKNLREALAEEQPEGLIQKEPAPWLLAAIILYLARIREQGMRTKTVQQKMKKKKNSGRPIMIAKRPLSGYWGGLIFAFCS